MPRRIVCQEWTAAELVLALGLSPVAIGDVEGYRDWVVAPTLPPTVRDVGSRFEPNREALLALQPDLLVLTDGYGLDAPDLERFGEVVTISPFEDGIEPLVHAERETMRLADLLGVPQAGQDLVVDAKAIFERCRVRLRSRGDEPVCVASIFEERTARIYGAEGLIGDTLRHLGVQNAWDGPVGSWGFSQVGLEQFARLPPDVRLVLLDPIPDPVRIRLSASSLWNGLPAVREGRLVHMAPVWPFGGLPAASRFASLLAEALSPR